MAKVCSSEGCNTPVFSKGLCQNHWKREHGKPLKQNTKPIVIRTGKIKPQRDSEKEIKVALSLLKREIKLEAVQNNEYYCAGCGKGTIALDCSHILAVGYRKDLELCKENINLLCRRCHLIHESRDIYLMIKLNCFEKDLDFIKRHDIDTYNKLKTKIIYSSFDHYLKHVRNEQRD